MTSPVDIEALIGRLRSVLQAKSDADLARKLGLSDRSVLTNWKRRGTTPLSECLQVSRENGISLDWLLTGEGEMNRYSTNGETRIGDAVNECGCGRYIPEQSPELAALERRLAALRGLLSDLDPDSREAILSDCLSRAADAQRISELERAVNELKSVQRPK